MSGDNRTTFDDDSPFADRRSRDGGLHPVGEVFAELLDQYRIRFPDINVLVVEQPSITR